MTFADEATTLHGDSAPSGATDDAPQLAEGVELIGEYEGSGFKEPPSLIRRGDGQVIQMPPLLYSVAAKADGRHSYEHIADTVSDEIQRRLDADQVRFLVDEKLRPMGVVANADGSSPAVEKADPFLALKFRAAVIPERVSDALGGLFKPLFLPVIVLAVLAGFVAADAWLFFQHGVAQSIRQSILHPGLFLALFGAVVLGAAFHEIGHAAACRYGGGHPGKMGCGLYLAWPAFYTDVTDAYRLGRRARLRTDLGGVYFNIVIVLATTGAYFATHFEPLLLLVVIQHFEIAHQLLPVIRLDGYYIIADLTGVPDLFARIGPILSSMIPGRKPDDSVRVLKRWVRLAVTAWVLIVVPLLVFELLMVLIHLPRILGTAWTSGTHEYHAATVAFSSSHTLEGVSAGLQLVVLAIPILGILLMLAKAGSGSGKWMWTHTEGRPVLRTFAGVGAVAGLVLLAMAWIPSHNYKPIQPGERGTVSEATRAMRRLPSGSAPLYSDRMARRRAATHPTIGSTGIVSHSTTTVRSGNTTDTVGSTGDTTDSTFSSSGVSSSPSTTTMAGTSDTTASTTTSTSTTSTTEPTTSTTSGTSDTSTP